MGHSLAAPLGGPGLARQGDTALRSSWHPGCTADVATAVRGELDLGFSKAKLFLLKSLW